MEALRRGDPGRPARRSPRWPSTRFGGLDSQPGRIRALLPLPRAAGARAVAAHGRALRRGPRPTRTRRHRRATAPGRARRRGSTPSSSCSPREIRGQLAEARGADETARALEPPRHRGHRLPRCVAPSAGRDARGDPAAGPGAGHEDGPSAPASRSRSARRPADGPPIALVGRRAARPGLPAAARSPGPTSTSCATSRAPWPSSRRSR